MNTKKNILSKSVIENNKQSEPIFYRLIFAGNSGVGKTQIINVYNKKIFQTEHSPTFGIDFQIKTINLIGRKANVYCIDTDGSEDFSENTGKVFIKKADAFVLIYDITSRESFNNLYKYYNMFKFALNDIENQYKKKMLYIVGNKYDLRMNRLVSENEASQMAQKYEAKYLEVSAKNGINIDRLFDAIIQYIIRREENKNPNYSGQFRGNNIYRNINSIKSNDSLKNTNRFFTENESGLNVETSSYFLKTKNNILNNTANNNSCNNINQFQEKQNRDDYRRSFYYTQSNFNKTSKCSIF